LLLLGLTKAKWLLVIFKFKAFATFGSLFLSLGLYAVAFGLPFAAGFIALLFIHELGHALVMRQQGIKTTPILFIPFMGAVIGMKEMPKNVYAEAKMALGGPILGSIGALGCLALWQVTGQPLFVALAMVGFWLNLFNLIPVSPLDGGRAMAAISPWGWLVGLAMLLLLFLRVHSIFLGFILIVGGLEVFNRWRSRNNDRAYYEATLQQRLIITGIYFGLAALLAFGVFAIQGHVLAGQPVR
jgi:Zn-dependent protease